MRSLLLVAVLLLVPLAAADLPSCVRARCPHCAVEFIARMCPSVCSSCPRAAGAPTQQLSTNYDAKSGVQHKVAPAIHHQVAAPQPAVTIARPQQNGVSNTIGAPLHPQQLQQPQPQQQLRQPPQPIQLNAPLPAVPQQQQQQQQQYHGLQPQQPFIPPSPAFSAQPLNIPPPPPAIPLPPYSPPQQQQPNPSFTGNYTQNNQRSGPHVVQPRLANPQPPPPPPPAPSAPQPAPVFAHQQPSPFAYPHPYPQQQQQQLQPQQPQQPFGLPQQPQQPQQQPNPFNPFQPLPQYPQAQQPFDLFHPHPPHPGFFPQGSNPFNPFAPPQPAPGAAGAAAAQQQAQQSALLNPFAPFLHQSFQAGGVTTSPLGQQFNPFSLPTLPPLTPPSSTPPPLQPLPAAPQTFFDQRQAGQQQPLPAAGGAQQQQHVAAPPPPQPAAPQPQPAFPNYQQPFPGMPQHPMFPMMQLPSPFNPQPQQFVPPPPPQQPAAAQQVVAPQQVVPQPQQPARAAVISPSIDAVPATYNKETNTYVGLKAGANIDKKLQQQCPSQPGWGACISKQLANERFRNCCTRLGDGCMPLCDYDATLTNMQLAVLTGRCPLAKVGDVMICASGYEDATPCCQAYGVFEPGYEHCRPYCNPAGGLPEGGLLSEKYKCLVKLTQIQQCFYVTQRP